ncbi:MAG: dienelactone hydrolase [Pseudomonadota bacterium]
MRFQSVIVTAIWAAAVSIFGVVPATSMEFETGVKSFTVPTAERDTLLDVTLWYPAEAGGAPVELGGNIFFEGTPAFQDAPMADGRFPLILLSHGAGLAGRAEAMSWIAGPLAAKGFVVAGPTHPRNTGPDRSAEETMKLWLRPSDLSAVLDQIESDPALSAQVELSKTGVLGLSMGGNSALSLVGAQIDPERLAGYCDAPEPINSLCAWVQATGADLHQFDKEAAGRDSSDARVSYAVAIDPALVDVLAADSFARVDVPVTLINLGFPEDLDPSLNAAPIAAAIPSARYEVIEDASHYSMFGLCKPAAAAIAQEEGIEDPICENGPSRSRAEIHADLIARVAAHIEAALQSVD